MSGSDDSRTSDGSPRYDTGLFDPNVHDNQIVALYETDEDARSARDKLVAAGLEATAVQVMDRQADQMAGGVDYERGDQGIWGAIKGLFMPDDDAHAYNHAVDKGHAMVVVTPTASTDRHHIIGVLESTGPIDFDARLEEWRQSGYDYTGAANSTDNRNTASRIPTDYAANQTTVTDQIPTSNTDAPGSESGNQAAPSAAQADVSGSRTEPVGGREASEVAKEQLRVGKREAAQGAVRVRSYVVERPVEK